MCRRGLLPFTRYSHLKSSFLTTAPSRRLAQSQPLTQGVNQHMVLNIHARDLHASRDAVGALLDSLASDQDLLWPGDRWPAMRFDRPLQVGAVGGHGPIRYRVEKYEPGRAILFRLTGRGVHRTHGFEIKDSTPGMVRLEHRLCMRVSGVARLSWPLMFRWLHDALVEDALDRAEAAVTSRPLHERHWSLWVRFLRRVASGQ
jgi:hypothetical protein